MNCDKAPKGWQCTREAGHDDKCTIVKIPWYKRLGDAVGNAIGEAKFGQ